jgi:KIF-binding protein
MQEELIRFKTDFDEYLRLNYAKSRSDPDDEPYKSKYEARKLIEELINRANRLNASTSVECNQTRRNESTSRNENVRDGIYENLNEICMKKYSLSSREFLLLKLLEYNLAKNYIETEEVESGEKLVSKITRELNELCNLNQTITYNPLLFNLMLSCLNDLCFVWSCRGDYKKCLSLLTKAQEIYDAYKSDESSSSSAAFSAPIDPSELIIANENLSSQKRKSNFEALYTHSLFYMAQVYGKLEDKERSADYCRQTLQRQLDQEQSKDESGSESDQLTEELRELNLLHLQPQERVSFNELDWATHAAALSQYYVCENDFATARHCLCCAEAVLAKLHEDALKLKRSNASSDQEKLNEQTNSIRRCWAKYAIQLLKTSKAKMLESTEHADQRLLLDELDKPSKFRFNLPSRLYKLSECERCAIKSNLPLDYEQAREVFLKAQRILDEAKSFFVLDGYVTDHCEILRDLSELYACLMFYEADPERRCKMYKRRLDLLVPVCGELSEQFYLTLKRQLLFDIGTIYSEMMDTKLDIFKSKKERAQLNAAESANAVAKINQLAKSAAKCFEQFLDTMKAQPRKESLPEKFDAHNVRPALLAKFYLGRLHSKIIVGADVQQKLSNMKLTIENYKYIVEYCDKECRAGNNEPLELMRVEYPICKEMITFLPVEMEKLRAATAVL